MRVLDYSGLSPLLALQSIRRYVCVNITNVADCNLMQFGLFSRNELFSLFNHQLLSCNSYFIHIEGEPALLISIIMTCVVMFC